MLKTYQLKDDLLMAEKDEMLYVLDLESGSIHSFNQTGKVIVQLCLEPRSLEEISGEYRQYFDLEADPARARKTLGDLLPELRVLFPEIAEAAGRDSQSSIAPKREDRTFTLDLLARTVALPIELPVGAVMALLGAPVFVWFLARGGR